MAEDNQAKQAMSKTEKAMVLLFELRMVALYRPIVTNGPLSKLEKLLDASMMVGEKRKVDRLERASIYSDLVYEIFDHGGALGPYIEDAVLSLDNEYVRILKAGKTPSGPMAAAFKKEMDLFTRLSVLTSGELIEMAGLPKTMTAFDVVPRNMISSVPERIKHMVQENELKQQAAKREADEKANEIANETSATIAGEIAPAPEKDVFSDLIEALAAQCYYEIVDDRMFEEIGIQKEDVVLPRIATPGSAGADFFAPFDIDLAPWAEIKVPTGIKAHCHPYTRLSIVPKSGLGFKYYTRLANTIGTIDADYYGNPGNDGCIFVKLRNEGEKPLHIAKGESFCQGIFEPYIPDRDAASIEMTERQGGFGSTEAKA